MKQAEIDQLTDELIDAKASVTDLEHKLFGLRDDLSASELAWMQLKDDYSALARAIGMQGDTFWGDPLASHADVLARAKELASFARVA